MDLTIPEAAARLGKSERQIRYLIRKGDLPARKTAGRWLIDSTSLPLGDGQKSAAERTQRLFRSAVEKALDLRPDEEDGRRRYSILDLRAFQIARPLYRSAVQALGEEHPATDALRKTLELLTQGCHRYRRSEKAEAYQAARDRASAAVCELVLTESAEAERIAFQIEQELMGALAGLLRRVDRSRHF